MIIRLRESLYIGRPERLLSQEEMLDKNKATNDMRRCLRQKPSGEGLRVIASRKSVEIRERERRRNADDCVKRRCISGCAE